MPAIICNVCRQPISDSAEQVDRVYKIKNYPGVPDGRLLPTQKKHDACDAAYAAERTNLEKVEG